MSVPSTYGGQPLVAADPSKAGHFTVVLAVNRDTAFQVYQTRDAGNTWSGPTSVVTDDPNKAHANAAIAYGPKGDLGIAWKTRDAPLPATPAAPGGGQGGGFGAQVQAPFNVFVVVSKDGGATFSQPMKMDSAEELPAPPSNRPFALSHNGGASIALTGNSVLAAWPDWRTGEASIMFNAVKLAAFKYE